MPFAHCLTLSLICQPRHLNKEEWSTFISSRYWYLNNFITFYQKINRVIHKNKNCIYTLTNCKSKFSLDKLIKVQCIVYIEGHKRVGWLATVCHQGDLDLYFTIRQLWLCPRASSSRHEQINQSGVRPNQCITLQSIVSGHQAQ